MRKKCLKTECAENLISMVLEKQQNRYKTYEQYNETNRGKQQLDNEGFCSGIHKVKKNTGLQIKNKRIVICLSKISKKLVLRSRIRMFLGLPDPDPLVRSRYGSGSFFHQAKIVRKTLIGIVL